MEALILTMDVACMVYLCWRFYKRAPLKPKGDLDLGWLSYRQDGDA